jgi:hypothetical protein
MPMICYNTAGLENYCFEQSKLGKIRKCYRDEKNKHGQFVQKLVSPLSINENIAGLIGYFLSGACWRFCGF